MQPFIKLLLLITHQLKVELQFVVEKEDIAELQTMEHSFGRVLSAVVVEVTHIVKLVTVMTAGMLISAKANALLAPQLCAVNVSK